MSDGKCEFCGQDPYERVEGIPVTVNCCDLGWLAYEQGYPIEEVRRWAITILDEDSTVDDDCDKRGQAYE